MPAADIRALLDALLPEGSAADSRGDEAVAPERAAPSQKALVIASLLQCPDRGSRDADSSADRSS